MKLGELLTKQRQALEALLDLLREEQDLLVHSDVDGVRLRDVVAAKSQPLQEIAALEGQRASMQARSGFGADLKASERFAAQSGCLEAWCAVQDLARQTAYLNELNGSVIQFRMKHNQRVLDDLWRIAGKPLYSADGLTRLNTGNLQSQA